MNSPSIPTGKYILAVDDTPDNLFLIQLALEQEGHRVQLAHDGNTALEQIKKSPPDLILLDVMMPGLSGYEVTQRIREDLSLPFIPIILITAFDQMSMVKGLDVGGDDFIRKPVKVDELQAKVRALLRLKHTIDQRENFVSCLTHDLRTPLVATDRMLSLVQQGVFGDVSEETKDAINTVINSNQNLLLMLNNLLEVHCYEVGQKILSFVSFNLSELIEEVKAELMPLAREKSLELRAHCCPNIQEIEGDRLELRRVFTNLISNAIKFTDSGLIEVRLNSMVRSRSGGGASSTKNKNQVDTQTVPWIAIEVEDTGIGIAAENTTTIFERFRKGNHKRSGHGLGLHLCNQIIQAHQGTISVKSQLHKGTVFTLCLPEKAAQNE
jgi:two-component system, sensor histidine kinase and response regulator